MARLPIEAHGLGSIKKKEGGATASQTWVRGAVLVAASGRISEGGTNPTLILGVAIHGVTSAVADAPAQYIPAFPGQEFVASIDTSASLGTGAIALADRYADYGITEDASGVWYVDKNKTSDATVRVTVTDLLDPIGTVNGRVKIVFHQHGDLGGTPVKVTAYAGSV